MSAALKAEAWAWRFTQTVKWLAGFQDTSESRLPGPLEPGELWLPSVQSTGESFYCLYDKNFMLILNCELSSDIFTDFRKLFDLQSVKISNW